MKKNGSLKNRKLYTVKLTMEVAVVAASAGEAERYAEDNVRHWRDLSELHGTAQKSFSMPDGWDEGCLPFGDTTPAKTIGEWLTAEKGGAAR